MQALPHSTSKPNPVWKFIQSLVLALGLSSLSVLAGKGVVWADLPLLPGQAITTHFSATENNTIKPFLEGKVLTVLDIRDPVAANAPFILPDSVNWVVPRYQHASWDAATLGEVFGLALDTSKAQPDIYVASTSSLYFVSTGFNMTPGSLASGYGAVFKIDGTSGAVSLLANLPSASYLEDDTFIRYAGLAQIAANPTARMLYVANYEDGKIYVLNMDTGATVETFDHGLQAASPSIADDDTAGFTALGRRVSAVQYHPVEQRLYYSVWAADGNYVWSIPLASNGTTTGAARFELFEARTWSPKYAIITDMAFSQDGQRLLIGQMPFLEGFSISRNAHVGWVTERLGSSGSWTLNNSLESGDGTIPVGTYNAKINGSGAVSYGYNNYGPNAGASEPCEDAFVLMGDALQFPVSFTVPYVPYVYGLQITPLTGTTVDTLGQDDYTVDLENLVEDDENMDKSGLGDVEVLSGCAAPPLTGTLTISKAVAGGTDPQAFTLQLDCSDNSFDNSAITLTAGATHTVNNIPEGTTCTITETPPSAPSGYTYSTPLITPAKPITIVANSTVEVSVLNQMSALETDLKLTKTVDGGVTSVHRGDTVKYVLLLENESTVAANGVVVSDVLPSSLAYVSHSPALENYDSLSGQWTVGTVAAQQTRSLTIEVTVK